MAQVPTANGTSIDSSALGVTMMHEHIFNFSPEVNQNWPGTFGDEPSHMAEALKQLNDAKASGVDTIVDLTVIGLGRYVPRVKRLAEQTRLNIVVATGIYLWCSLPMFFAIRGPGTRAGGDEYITDYFLRDIREGIGDSGVRAGIIKCTTDSPGLTQDVERVIRAAAQAHRQTGVPISTHTFDAPNGLDQQRILAAEGVDLSRVVAIGHVDRGSRDPGYLRGLLSAGSFIGFDRFGLPSATFDERIERIAALCEQGYADRIVLSQDHVCYCDFPTFDLFASNPEWRYTTVVGKGVPALRERGVSEADIRKMLVDNPRRIFETTALGAY